MMRCPPLCERNTKKKENRKIKKRRRIAGCDVARE